MSTYHHGDLGAAVLRAAGKLLEKQGISKLSVREAARRAGVSHNAPYRHFPDRESLLVALAAEGFSVLGENVKDRSGREMGEAYVRFALEHPQRFRLMFGGLLELDAKPELRAAASRTYEILVNAFRAHPGVSAPERAAAAAWSLVHGLSHLLLDGHFQSQNDIPKFVRDVIGAVRFAQRSA
jgi:AcrR family transcriptional regulator